MSHPALYDAIVVGSGATGGVAAKQLAEGGLRVLVLEAGRNFQGGARHGSPMTNLMRQLYRHFVTGRQRVQERQGGYWETNPDLFVNDIDHPYVTPADRPYRWIRGRHLGGRSLSWGGVTLRFSDFEFKAASRDGIGEDWPIGYEDLEPFYAEVEQFLGTHGSKEGLAQLPDGVFREPRPMTPAEQRLAAAVTRFPDRRADHLARHSRRPLPRPWRAATHGSRAPGPPWQRRSPRAHDRANRRGGLETARERVAARPPSSTSTRPAGRFTKRTAA